MADAGAPPLAPSRPVVSHDVYPRLARRALVSDGQQAHSARSAHSARRVLNVLLTPGNWDDRTAALALGQEVDGGITLSDLGYRGDDCATELAEAANMLLIIRDRAPAHRFVLSQGRQQIETTLSQLWWKFVDRVFSRSWQELWNTLQLKVLYYNLRHAGILSA
jgi:IS5 family transposase